MLMLHCLLLKINQSAYRQFHSTETALLKVQSDILSNVDNQEVVLLVMLDLSAAFDTTDHRILLDILEKDFGVIGNAKKWLMSFLCERKQRVIAIIASHLLLTCRLVLPKAVAWVPSYSCFMFQACLRLYLNTFPGITPLLMIHNCIFLGPRHHAMNFARS